MRQHGGVADTCIHGFASGTCLICQTLQSGPATATKEASAGGNGKRRRRSASVPAELRPAPTPAPVRPDAIETRPARTGLGVRLVGFLILAIVAVIAAWVVLGFVLAVLRIVEIVAAALVAGWVGWKLGVRHGRRTRT
jgi:Flp pilus assembly protein TadB